MPDPRRDAGLVCVVPAAGRGTRLLPLTRERPKALLDLAGRPLIDRLIGVLAEVVDEVCLVVDPEGDELREELGESRYGVRLSYAVQLEPRGVAHAALQARDRLAGRGPFLVAMGDCYYEDSLAPTIESWRDSGAGGAVVVEPVRPPARGSMGLVEVRGGRVERIVKAEPRGKAGHRVAGAMVLPADGFEACAAVSAAGTGEAELEDAVTWLMDRGVEFAAVAYDGWRRNINTEEELNEVVQRIESGGTPEGQR